MLISLYQMQPISGDAAANLSKIAQAAAAASDMGSDLLVTPELSATGYALSPDQFAEIAERCRKAARLAEAGHLLVARSGRT